ncbi:hypothetical protein DVA81_18510, partial [Acinetobacter baumannii]
PSHTVPSNWEHYTHTEINTAGTNKPAAKENCKLVKKQPHEITTTCTKTWIHFYEINKDKTLMREPVD